MMDHQRRRTLLALGAAAAGAAMPWTANAQASRLQAWPLDTPRATGIHDVAPAPDGGVWFTAQRSGHLGWFDPKTGRTELVALGRGSSPHGVIQGPDKAAWITDSGQNAIARVSWPDREVRLFKLPDGSPYANLNTCAFDGDGDLWFTGPERRRRQGRGEDGPGDGEAVAQGSGSLRHLHDAERRRVVVFARGLVHRADRPADRRLDRGRTADAAAGCAPRVERQPRPHLGERMAVGQRVGVRPGAKSRGACGSCPGSSPRTYAVYVDDRDQVWLSEWSANATVRFDPDTEKFESFPSPRLHANVRQILGRPGEVWLPESGTEHIAVIRTA